MVFIRCRRLQGTGLGKCLTPDWLTWIWLSIPTVMWQQHCGKNNRGLSGPNSLGGLAVWLFVWLLTNDAVNTLHSLTFYQLLPPWSVCGSQIGIITNGETGRRRATDAETETLRVTVFVWFWCNMLTRKNGGREKGTKGEEKRNSVMI